MVIRVRHEPRKEVVIHEMSQYGSAEQMAKSMVIGMQPGMLTPILRWVNGVVLEFTAIQINTERVANDRLKGILHWDYVSFAPMPEYKPTIKLSNGVVLEIADVSTNETFVAIGKFLRSKITKK
jgi:hypothetical protein